MIRTYTFLELSESQVTTYKNTVQSAFPEVIFQSEVVKHCWSKIERYFPDYQIFYIDSNDDLIGFINAIPIFWNQPVSELPDEGWDWLVERGIEGFEKNIKPNCIGGLQIIVSKKYLGKGYSKRLVAEGKKIKEKLGFDNFIIPIRPTFKSQFPEMDMNAYIDFKKGGKLYDPWIRTHLSSGAKVIKVCPNAMYIHGSIAYWEDLIGKKINTSGQYAVEGALNLVSMNLENDIGEYHEDNIWIHYD